MNLRTIQRYLEITIVIIICAIIVFLYFHYLKIIPYFRIVGIILSWIIYKIVKFISIRNKKLFIKTY